MTSQYLIRGILVLAVFIGGTWAKGPLWADDTPAASPAVKSAPSSKKETQTPVSSKSKKKGKSGDISVKDEKNNKGNKGNNRNAGGPEESQKGKQAFPPGKDSAMNPLPENTENAENATPPENAENVSGGEDWLTPQAVQAGIEGAISYLKKSQRGGAWEEYPGYDPGTTSLCLLALLSAGLTPEDPSVAAGLRYLEKFTPEQQNQTYPIALQTMVLCQADPKTYREIIAANAAWLIDRQFKTENNYRGGWSYTGLQPAYSMADNSNSQFAVLALYEAEKAGVPIPASVWSEVEAYWIRMQNADGSWGYRGEAKSAENGNPSAASNPSGKGTGSMTCAGIVSLLISDLHRGEGASVLGGKIACCQELETENQVRIQRGLDWMAKHFSVRNNPGTGVNADTYIFYYLYGLERTGRLTANRFIGQNDWYREGTAYLLQRKGALSHFWKAGIDLGRINAVATSFALLFLSKGRWPVLISKLNYDETSSSADAKGTGEWNLHPNDLDHLTRYAESQWNQKMTWQVISAQSATVDDYIQTPVLSLTGRKSPLPQDATARKRFVEGIRGYLEQGGFLIAEALDGDESFESGFIEMMKEVFPDEENGGLHLLAKDHPIWTGEKKIPPEKMRPLYGIDFGCRTSVIFIPPYKPSGQGNLPPSVSDDRPSLSCLWELGSSIFRENDYSEDVRSEIDAALNIGLNILAYATDRELKFKEEIPENLKDLDGPETRNVNFYVSLLDLGVGSACASRAIPNLTRKMASDLGIPIRPQVRRVRADSPDLFYSPVLFLHGRSALSLSDAEIENLRNYFDRGGFLFANAVCASRKFSVSLEEALKKIFPDEELKPIPADDPLFTNRYGGWTLQKLEINKPTRQDGGKTVTQKVSAAPPLKGIQKEGRWVVVFSPLDVSCALERQGSVECPGYTPESAFKLSVNIVLYAMEHL